MLTLILIMLFGITIGRIFRKKKLLKESSKFIFPIVLVLLFQMGIQIGTNELIIQNLSRLGLEALLITMGALSGTLAGAYLLWHYLFAHRKENINKAE